MGLLGWIKDSARQTWNVSDVTDAGKRQGPLPVEVMSGAANITLNAGDIQIGAVENKNYNTDDRQFIGPDHFAAVQTAPANAVVKGCEAITVDASQKALTVPAGADYALISCGAATVRWRDDGNAVAAGDAGGHPLFANDQLKYDGNLAAIRFTREAATSGVLFVSYYGRD